MLAEEMSVAESSRAVAALQAEGIHVNDMVVNRLTAPPPSTCALCDERRRVEAEWLNAIATRAGGQDVNLWTLAAREDPPQGLDALRAVARSVSRLKRPAMRRKAERDGERCGSRCAAASGAPRAASPFAERRAC